MTTTNEGAQRDELAVVIAYEADRHHGFAGSNLPPAQQDRELADAILAAGYRKPRILGYAVVGLTGRLFGGDSGYLTREAAQAAADSENAELGPEGEEPFYRVAEIAEATR